jgi:hypothetical protein
MSVRVGTRTASSSHPDRKERLRWEEKREVEVGCTEVGRDEQEKLSEKAFRR